MQIRLMDILADPDNPDIWPLKLRILREETREVNTKPFPHKSTNLLCKFYCYKEGKYLVNDPLGENEKTLSPEEIAKISSLDKCYECIKTEVQDGIIYHDKNEKRKWFIVFDGIAVMHGKANRNSRVEGAFFQKYPEIRQEMNLEDIN